MILFRANTLKTFGTRFMPFADAASDTLPMGELLRLSLFQVSVGMALVMLLGTLNRVMIVELSVPAMIVAVMIALPASSKRSLSAIIWPSSAASRWPPNTTSLVDSVGPLDAYR